MASEAQDAEAQRLKAEVEELKQRIRACKTVHDYFQLTEKANQIAKAAASACRRRQLLLEPARGADAAAAGAEDGQAAADAAAEAAATKPGQLPATDDGVTCMLLRLPNGWGTARLQAFIERFGAKPSSVTKNSGEAHAVVVFSAPEHRTLFWGEFQKADQAGGSVGSAGQFLVKFPAGAKPGAKRSAAEAGVSGEEAAGEEQGGRRRKVKQLKSDIRDVVCPWWNRPYAEQLNNKIDMVNITLRHLSEKVAHGYGRGGDKPAWLSAALQRPGKEAAVLPGIVRSPQLNGYRNKAEFTIGLDSQERPTAGFLLGNYVDGVTQVADAAECRHISPTALAYAAAMNDFLRSSDNQLPVWDKRHGKGFWRLLTVREGRSASFLPLPAPPPPPAAAATDGGQQPQQEVLAPNTPLGQVPVDRWLVKIPTLMDEGQLGVELAQVTEQEPVAPTPADAIVMVQIDSTAASGPEQISQQLQALGSALKAAAAAKSLPLTALLVQYHSGVANAAPQTAPLTYFPGEQPAAAAAVAAGGSSQVGSFNDVLCEVKFRVSPNAFFQVNNSATCLLYNAVGRMAAVGPETLLLDVCCGTGTIGITLAKQVRAVIGIDNVESAIADAHVNASLNGITNADFVCDTAENAMDRVLKEHAPKYSHVVAVVDPPRAGLHRNVLRALLACPALKRLVFVSCNPDTLVLNAGLLCAKYRPDGMSGGKGGQGGRGGGRHRQADVLPPMEPYIPFRPTQVLAFDLFPHTKHVEVVMLLERE